MLATERVERHLKRSNGATIYDMMECIPRNQRTIYRALRTLRAAGRVYAVRIGLYHFWYLNEV